MLAGMAAAIAAELLCGAAVWLALLLLKQPLPESLRWFGLCFVPPMLLLRHYAKKRSQGMATKGIIAALFVTFVAFMWLFVKQGGLNN